jgi:NADPH:quinone reductase-like Zn-dependent oxidoreductase
MTTMKAALVRRYGSPAEVYLAEVPRPEPKANELLIAVRATTVSAADWRIRSAHVPAGFGLFVRVAFGLRGPRQKVLGTELSGVVEAVGKQVQRFRPGDRVFAFPGTRMGAHAEYVVMAEDDCVQPVPATLDHAEAASICFGGTTALHFLRDKARLQPGEKLLVVGAAGSVGSAAVELGRHFGAEVTGVTSAKNLDFVKSLGADDVIDYQTEDFTELGRSFDVILDCAGTAPFERSRRALLPGGRLLLVIATLGQMLAAPLQSRSGLRVSAGGTPELRADVATLAELCTRGQYRPRVGATFPFEQIAKAHALVESQHKRGSAVVLLGQTV